SGSCDRAIKYRLAPPAAQLSSLWLCHSVPLERITGASTAACILDEDSACHKIVDIEGCGAG
ncbi:hypothetical protein VWR13_22510, partial [Xanthomonas citri pv. citri]